MLSLESTSARISNLARQVMYFNRFLSLDEMLASIEIVTRDEVLAIAHDFFEPGRLALTVLGNLKVCASPLNCLPDRMRSSGQPLVAFS